MKVSKNALFAVRLEQCAEPDKAEINGVAEGLVDGARASAPVAVSAAGSPGAYVVSPGWQDGRGGWVVSLSATCGNAKAGALVPIGASGFQRENVKLLPHAPTKTEIEAALKALDASGK